MQHIIITFFLIGLFSIASSAQKPADSWENLKQLQPGHKVKVVDMKLRSWSGKLVSVSDEAITIREERKKQEITVERANLLRVTNLQRSKRCRNALIGLATGIVIGGIHYESADSGDLAPWGVVLYVVGIWGGTGAAVGALVPSRPTIYRTKVAADTLPPNPPDASSSPQK